MLAPQLVATYCLGCSLDKAANLRNPKMSPTVGRQVKLGNGNWREKPRIYLIGEGPGELEDAQDEQFVGQSGQLLRQSIPKWAEELIIWDNVVRCRPTEKGERGGLKNRTPTDNELAHCHAFTRDNLGHFDPDAILLLGNPALHRIWYQADNHGNLIIPKKYNQDGTRKDDVVRVGETRGLWFTTRINNKYIPCYSTYHPSSAIRARNNQTAAEGIVIRTDLELFFNTLELLGPPQFPYASPQLTSTEGIVLMRPDSPAAFKAKLYELLGHAEVPALDFETNGLIPFGSGARVITAALSDGVKTLAIDLPPTNWQSYIKIITQYLAERKWIAHNVQFELSWLLYCCPELRKYLVKNFIDTELMIRALHARIGTMGLDTATRMYLGTDIKALSNIDTRNIEQYPIHEVMLYNAFDAKSTAILLPAITDDATWTADKLAESDALHAVTPLIVEMELKGLPLDDQRINDLIAKTHRDEEAIQQRVASMPDVQAFNLANNVQTRLSAPNYVAKVLTELYHVQLPKTAKDNDQTDIKALEPLKNIPFAKLVLDYRHTSKLRSTYLVPMLPETKRKKLVRIGARIHPHYSAVMTDTGRWSAKQPNIQNFPKRRDSEVRGMIISDCGPLLAYDYRMLEARVIAMKTRDRVLINEITNGIDIHAKWAKLVLDAYPEYAIHCLDAAGIDLEQNIDDAERFDIVRSTIKNEMVFAKFYGSDVGNCSERMEVPIDVLTPIDRQFWEHYSDAKESLLRDQQEYYKTGGIKGLTYRARGGLLDNEQIANSPIQGTAADIVRDACIRLYNLALDRDDPQLMPRIHVHDELVFFPTEDHIEEIFELIAYEMVKPMRPFVCVPLAVKASLGPNWAEMETIGEIAGEAWQ